MTALDLETPQAQSENARLLTQIYNELTRYHLSGETVSMEQLFDVDERIKTCQKTSRLKKVVQKPIKIALSNFTTCWLSSLTKKTMRRELKRIYLELLNQINPMQKLFFVWDSVITRERIRKSLAKPLPVLTKWENLPKKQKSRAIVWG